MKAADIARARGPVTVSALNAALYALILLGTGATAATWFIAIFILTPP